MSELQWNRSQGPVTQPFVWWHPAGQARGVMAAANFTAAACLRLRNLTHVP